MTPAQIVNDLLAQYRERGHRHYGENVSESQHALQCALFARQNGEPDALVAACLLHDYGHLVHDLDEDFADRGIDDRHENLGAERLAKLFGEDVVEPIRLHVAAKRYLCGKDHRYHDSLSAVSQQSLQLQGGPMTPLELAAFERHPYFRAALRLRGYDDQGKAPDLATPDFEAYRDLLERLVVVSA
jgi:phosphonate degradation associated HDIG domain protein